MFRKSKARTEGHDSHMMPVKLGEKDTDGHVVGYIDEEGLSWESREERDAAVGAGRIADEFYPKTPATLFSLKKSIDDVLNDAEVLKENRYLACKEFIDQLIIRNFMRNTAELAARATEFKSEEPKMTRKTEYEEQVHRIGQALGHCPKPGCGGLFIPYKHKLSKEDHAKAIEVGYLPPAISRLDNKTEICSSCGTKEAIDDFMRPGR